MVNEYPTSPDSQQPQPYDTVYLRAGNPFGMDPRTPLIIADAGHGLYELNHQDHHPDYWDWAAAAELDDIATVVRISPDGATRSWAPAS